MSVTEPHPAATQPRGMTRVMDFEDPETGQPALWFYYFIGEYGPAAEAAVMKRFITDIMKNKRREQAVEAED